MQADEQSESRAAWWMLPLCGLIVLAVMAWFASVESPRASVPSMTLFWVVGCLAVALATRAALRRPRREVVLLTLLFAAALRLSVLPMATTLSDDFYRYLWDGSEAVAGRSPYAATPMERIEQERLEPLTARSWLFTGMNSQNFRSVYPPVSQTAFAAAWAVGGGSERAAVADAVRVLRLVFGLADLAAVGVLLLVLRRMGRHPGWAVLYAWHPLPAVEAVGAMHTEALLALPLLAAVGLVVPRGSSSAGDPRDHASSSESSSASVPDSAPDSASTRRAAPARQGASPPARSPSARSFFTRRHPAPALAGLAVAFAAGVKLFPLAAAAVIAGRLRGRTRWCFLAAAAGAATLLLWPLLGPPHGAGVRASLALYSGYFSFNNPLFDALAWAWPGSSGDSGNAARGASRLMLGAFAASAAAVIGLAWSRRRASTPTLLVLLFGEYLACSPTVHPWYLLWVLWLVPLTGAARPAILWLAAAVPLTYLAYDPARSAWGVPAWVLAIEWGGAVLLLLFHDGRRLWIRPLMRARARWKAVRLAACLPAPAAGGRLLDVGCGEGLVTAGLARRTGLSATGVDVDVDAGPRGPVAVLPYDGRRLPFGGGRFEAVTLLTVLHHCDDPEAVLREAARVTRPGGRLLVAESVYRTRGGLWLLTRLDRFFNGLRGGGRAGLAGPLHFAREEVWLNRFAAAGLVLREQRYLSRGLHRHVLFVLDKPGTSGRP